MVYVSATPDGVDPAQFAPQGPTLVDSVTQTGLGLASTAAATTGYTPGQTYTPGAVVDVPYGPTAAPAYGRVPVAGETLYASSSTTTRLQIGDPGIGPMSDRGTATPVTVKTLQLATIEDTRADIFAMSEERLRALQKQFGLKPTGFADPATVDAVDSFLGYVSDINASGVNQTWSQVLDKLTDGGDKTLDEVLNGSSAAEKPFTGSKSTVSSNVQTVSPSEVRGLTEQTFASVLGRAPTKAERKRIRAEMNSRAESNPVVTKTTTDYEKGDAVSSHSTTNGGPDFAQIAMNEARSQEGAGEYQAINFFDTMMATLAAPVAG